MTKFKDAEGTEHTYINYKSLIIMFLTAMVGVGILMGALFFRRAEGTQVRQQVCDNSRRIELLEANYSKLLEENYKTNRKLDLLLFKLGVNVKNYE